MLPIASALNAKRRRMYSKRRPPAWHAARMLEGNYRGGRLQVLPRRRWPRVGVVTSTGVRPTRLVTLKTKQPARRTAATIAPSFATAHGPFHYHVRLACICQEMNIADRALLHVVTHAHDASFEPTRANLTPSP